VADILRLETEGAVGSAEAKCVDEAETAKAICTQRVVDKYNPDSSTAVVNKSPDHHFKALEFMMTDAILDKEEEMEELMREEYEDFDDDGPDSEDANNEISSLRRSSRQMSKKKKKGSVWGKKRKKMTPLEKKKRKMYLAWSKCARKAKDVYEDCIEFGPEQTVNTDPSGMPADLAADSSDPRLVGPDAAKMAQTLGW
jgi:hypothetical protein